MKYIQGFRMSSWRSWHYYTMRRGVKGYLRGLHLPCNPGTATPYILFSTWRYVGHSTFLVPSWALIPTSGDPYYKAYNSSSRYILKHIANIAILEFSKKVSSVGIMGCIPMHNYETYISSYLAFILHIYYQYFAANCN